MSQGTFPLAATQSGTQYTEDLNALLSGINSNNASNDAPESGLEEGVLWLDTSQTPPILRIYDASIPGFVPLGVNGDAFRTVVIYKNSLVTPTPVPSSTNTVLNVTLDGFTTNTQSWSLTQTTPGTGADTYTAIGTFEQANSIGDYTTVGDWSTPAQLSGNDGSTGARSPIIGFYVPMVTRDTTADPDTFTSPLANFNPDGLLGTNTDNQAYLDASFSQFFFGNLTSDAVEGDYGVFYNNSVETENLVASYDAASGNWITGTKKISGNLLVDGSITADAISATAITGKIVKGGKNALDDITPSGFFFNSDGEFIIGGGSENIVFNGTNLTVPALTITGELVASQIAAGTITANEIATGAITATQLSADSITADKILTLDLSVDKNVTVGSITLGADTELSVAAAVDDTSISVDSTEGFPSEGSVVLGDAERFKYTSKTATTFVSLNDVIETAFAIDTSVTAYVVNTGTKGGILEGIGRFAVGNFDNSITFDGEIVTISGVDLDAEALTNISALDGKISASLQSYSATAVYELDEAVISDNRIFRANGVVAINNAPENNTDNTAPFAANSWSEISPAAAGVTVDNAISENGTNPVQGGAIFTALAGKQAVDATLTAIAGLTAADGGFIVGTGTAEGNWTVESGSDARTSLGLGTVATLDTGTGSGNIPILNSSGKISSAVLDIVNLSDVENFTTIALRNASVATIWHKGDIAIITTGTDLGTYLYTGTDQTTAAATLSSAWTVLQLPTGVVTSVAGGDGVTASASTGTVTLSADIKANSGIVLTGTTPNKKLDLNLGASGITGTLAVQDGGTGASSLTDGGILLGSGTGAITATGVLTNGQMLVGDGTTDPVLESGATLRTSIGVGTGDSPLLTGVSVGNADTTITRNSAGNVNVEGKLLYRADGTDVPVKDGGTGTSSLTDGGILLGSGTNAITATAVLTNGQMIVGDGTGDPVLESGATLRTSIGVGTGDSPQFTAVNVGSTDTTISRNSAGNINVEGKLVYRADGTDVPVKDGGTGASTFTDGGILLGSGTDAITATAVLTNGQMIVGDGTGDPVLESGATLRTSIGVGTGDSPQFTAVNVGSTDTTITRESAGDIDIEGNIVYRAGGTDVPVADGGTGLSSVAAGDILYASGENTLAALTKGDDGKVLKLASGIPSWATDTDTNTTYTNGDGISISSDAVPKFSVNLDGSSLTNGTNGLKLTTHTGDVTGLTALTIGSGKVEGHANSDTTQQSDVEIKFGSIGTPDLRNSAVNNAKLGIGAISLDKMVIAEFPTVVWKTAYTLRDGSPDDNGDWQAYTDTDLTSVAGDNAEWDTIRGVKIRTTDAGGLDITNLINALETGSYIRIRQTATTFAVYKVGTTHTVSSNVGSISFQNDFQFEGVYGNKDTDIADIEFQVKTDAIVDGNLVVTGTLKASDITTDSLTANQITAANATFGNMVAEYAKITAIESESIDTNILNSGSIIVNRTLQVGDDLSDSSGNVVAPTGTDEGFFVKANGDLVFGNATNYVLWDTEASPSALTIRGTLNADDINAGTLSSSFLTIDGNINILPPTNEDDRSVQGWADSTAAAPIVRDWSPKGIDGTGTGQSAVPVANALDDILGLTASGSLDAAGGAATGANAGSSGFFLGQTEEGPRFFIGNADGSNSNFMKWNGTQLIVAGNSLVQINPYRTYYRNFNPFSGNSGGQNGYNAASWSLKTNASINKSVRSGNRTLRFVDATTMQVVFDRVDMNSDNSGTDIYDQISVGSTCRVTRTVDTATIPEVVDIRVLDHTRVESQGSDNSSGDFDWFQVEVTVVSGTPTDFLGQYANSDTDDDHDIVEFAWNHYVDKNQGIELNSLLNSGSYGKHIVLGENAIADEIGSIVAIGRNAQGLGEDAIAIGDGSRAGVKTAGANNDTGDSSIAIGASARASGDDSIYIGRPSGSLDRAGNEAISIGLASSANASDAIAIGKDADANFSNAIALGQDSDAGALEAIAIGQNADATGDRAIAIGSEADSTGAGSIAIGSNGGTANDQPKATGDFSIAIGVDAEALGDTSITSGLAIGNGAHANRKDAIAIGTGANTNAEGNISIGRSTNSTGALAMAIGDDANANGDGSIAFGPGTVTGAAANAGAIGNNATARAANIITLGGDDGAVTPVEQIVELSRQTDSDDNDLAVVTKLYLENNAGGNDYLVINSGGTAASAAGTDAIAIGESASAVAPNSVAIGTGATTGDTSSIDMFPAFLDATSGINNGSAWTMSTSDNLTSPNIDGLTVTNVLSSSIRTIVINNQSSVSLSSLTEISDALATSNRAFMDTVRAGDSISMTVQAANNTEITATSTATFVISGTPLYQADTSASIPQIATTIDEWWRIPVTITSEDINEFEGVSDGNVTLSTGSSGTNRLVQFHVQKAGGIAIGSGATVSGDNSMALGNGAVVASPTGVELIMDGLDNSGGITGAGDWRMKTSDDLNEIADGSSFDTLTLSNAVKTIFICNQGLESSAYPALQSDSAALANRRAMENVRAGDTLVLTLSPFCSEVDGFTGGTVNITLDEDPIYENDSAVAPINAGAGGEAEFWRLRVSITQAAINNLGGVSTGSVLLRGFRTFGIGQTRAASFRFDYADPSQYIDNRIVLGNNEIDFLQCNARVISSLSDERDKTDITDLSESDGLPFINDLQPRSYYWDRRSWYDNGTPDGSKKKTNYSASIPNSGKQMGFIAQEVEEVIEDLESISSSNLVTGNRQEKVMAYAELITPMVKAIQQLSSENDDLKARLDALENP